MGRDLFFTKWYHLYKPIMLLILTLTLILAQSDKSSFDSDKSALLEFKNSLSDPFKALSSWQGSHHCSWFGVICDSGFRVSGLNLSGSGNSGPFCDKFAQFPIYGGGIRRVCYDTGLKLSGKISPNLAKLTELRVLSLPFNKLIGELPDEINGLKNLEVLDLEGNSISGPLPNFRGLSRLRVLNLGFNNVFGEIPRSLSNCTRLQVLNLAGNIINGTIPEFIGLFRDLRGIYLSYNLLGGDIPREIGENCGKLEYLELAGNFIGGGIPSNLGKCRSLRYLILSSNLLLERIPIELGQLNSLEVLDLSRNSLSGSIPRELGNCSNLSVLVLSNLFNPLTNVTDSGDNEIRQSGLDKEFNFFVGEIPSEITMLSKLKMVWAPRALLEARLPENWGACNSLEMVNLGQNLFNGEISRGFSLCKNLHFLDLSSNRLKGEIFEKLLSPCLTVFDVSENLLSGPIPRFNYSACLRTYKDGKPRPDDLSAAYLSFFSEKAKAEFSSKLISDGSVISVYHNFCSNNFSGALPSLPIGLEKLSFSQTAYAFLAGGNKLNETFPGDLFHNCDGLKGLIVNVSNNKLSGQLPANISSICKSLKSLDGSANHITGSIPTTFRDFISLFSLNLSKNMLQGPIPKTISEINNLNFLSLAENNLSGPIPTSLGKLHSLQALDLSHNSLSGEIPNDLANLRNLTVLLLNNNKLLGKIPSRLANLTTLSTFDVSFNNLSGPILSNENLTKCSSFEGNPFLQSCRIFSLTTPSSDSPIESSPQNDNNSPSTEKSFNSIEIASITSASAIVSVLIALVILFFYTRRFDSRSKIGNIIRKEVTVFTDIGVLLTFDDVVRATGSFNATNCIGFGGFGATYKAEISPGVLVAIKRLAVGRFQGVQQFEAEIKTLGRLRHRNLVTLIGYHASETEMFLIYNYLPGGNLEKFITDRSTTRAPEWRILHKIALDVARALAYLHDECVPRVLHRDVKPSNILLNDDFNAYLSDFGLARLLGTSETHVTTGVAGTFGYVAPEYALTCRVSDKADVYSYGVVLLELLSDKKALDPSFSSYGNGFNIVQWSCMQLQQGKAKEFFCAGLWDVGPHDDLVEVLHLAVVCTVDSLSTRPTMKQVVRRLKQLQPPL